MRVNLHHYTLNHSEQDRQPCIIQQFIHKDGTEAFAARTALQSVINPSCVRASNRVRHFHNINDAVAGDTHHTHHYDKACDIKKKSMYAMSRWLWDTFNTITVTSRDRIMELNVWPIVRFNLFAAGKSYYGLTSWDAVGGNLEEKQLLSGAECLQAGEINNGLPGNAAVFTFFLSQMYLFFFA